MSWMKINLLLFWSIKSCFEGQQKICTFQPLQGEDVLLFLFLYFAVVRWISLHFELLVGQNQQHKFVDFCSERLICIFPYFITFKKQKQKTEPFCPQNNLQMNHQWKKKDGGAEVYIIKEPLILTVECCQHCKNIISAGCSDFVWHTSWPHLTLTFALEYDLAIGKGRRQLFYTTLLFVPNSVLSLYCPSLLSYPPLPPLSNSLTLGLPFASSSVPVLLSPISVFTLHLLLVTFLSPLSVSFSWGNPFSSGCWPGSHPLHSPCLAFGCCGEAPREKHSSCSSLSHFLPNSKYQQHRRETHCLTYVILY